MTEQEKELRDKELDDMVNMFFAKMKEHCDTVQVFVTIYDSASGETEGRSRGTGNFFAREGQVREWLRDLDAEKKD